MSKAFSIHAKIQRGSQLDFFEDGQKFTAGDQFPIEFPDNSRLGGTVVSADAAGGMVVNVGGVDWQLRRATDSDNPIRTDNLVPYLVVGP